MPNRLGNYSQTSLALLRRLDVLKDDDGATIKELEAVVTVKIGTIYQHLYRLQERGLVSFWKPLKKKWARRTWHLTEAGRQFVASLESKP